MRSGQKNVVVGMVLVLMIAALPAAASPAASSPRNFFAVWLEAIENLWNGLAPGNPAEDGSGDEIGGYILPAG